MRRTLRGLRLEAMAASVPSTIRSIDDEAGLFGGNTAQMARIKTNLGLGTRRVAREGETALDLCLHSALSLFSARPDLTGGIDILVFVTQTPDHFQPCNACVAHGALGLPHSVACLDLNLGCSGFVYGLFTAASMLLAGQGESLIPRGPDPAKTTPRRALILAGDTVSRALSPLDRSVAPIFGDGGSAAILRLDPDGPGQQPGRDPEASRWDFRLFTDGSGMKALTIPAGAYRVPSTAATREKTVRGDGITRSDEDLAMDGGAVMSFTLREVPLLIRTILGDRNWSADDPDLYALHQANRFILSNVAKAAGIPAAKTPWDIGGLYGNQSSASIPVTLCHHLGPRGASAPMAFDPASDETPPLTVADSPTKVVMAGFGVGLSWGACACDIGGAVVLPVIEMPENWRAEQIEATNQIEKDSAADGNTKPGAPDPVTGENGGPEPGKGAEA